MYERRVSNTGKAMKASRSVSLIPRLKWKQKNMLPRAIVKMKMVVIVGDVGRKNKRTR